MRVTESAVSCDVNCCKLLASLPNIYAMLPCFIVMYVSMVLSPCVDLVRRQRKKAEFSKRNNPHCQVDGVECTIMDNSHWKTEPKWDSK